MQRQAMITRPVSTPSTSSVTSPGRPALWRDRKRTRRTARPRTTGSAAHLAVYEWDRGARGAARHRHGLRRGLRLGRPARSGRAWSASTPIRRRTSMRACAIAGRTCALPATRRKFSEEADVVVLCRRSTPHDPGAALARASARSWAGAGRCSSRPQTCSRWRRGERRALDNPWHVHEYRAEGVRRAVPDAASRRSRCSGCFTRASCVRTSWR